MVIKLDGRGVSLAALVGVVLYMPLRAMVEMSVATNDVSGDILAQHFTLVRFFTPVVVVLLAVQVLTRWRSRYADVSYKSYVACLVFFFCVAFFYVLTLKRSLYDADGTHVSSFNLGVLLSHVLCLGLGVLLWRIKTGRLFVIFFWALMGLQVLLYVDLSSLAITVSLIDPEKIAVYLLYGDTYAVWSLIAIAAVRRKLFKLSVFVFSLAISFFLYSRTSFYGLLIVLPFFIFRLPLKFRIGFIACVFSLVVYAFVEYGSSLFEHRMFGFISDGQDESLALRQIQAYAGYSSLMKNWFFGDYAGQVRDFGAIGAYIHSLFSYWQQFGLVPFLSVVFMLWQCARVWWVRVRDTQVSEIGGEIFFLIFPFVLFESIFSRAYVFPYIWLLFGLYLGMPEKYRSVHSRKLAAQSSKK